MRCMKPLESHENQLFLAPTLWGESNSKPSPFHSVMSFLMQTRQKMQMWLKENVSADVTVLHCTGLSCFVLHCCALSCAVSSRSALCHFPGGFESEELPAVWACACLSVCLSVGPRNEAHCHSIQWPNAKGSRVQHYSLFSLCASSRLSAVIIVSPVTKHFVTLGQKRWWGLGGCWNVPCIDGL